MRPRAFPDLCRDLGAGARIAAATAGADAGLLALGARLDRKVSA